MVELMNVKDLDRYYERLNIGISMSTMWSTLQTKSEYGSDKSEKGYQQVGRTMAGNIARGLQLNPDLAEVLTMCKGAFFPIKGKQGKKCIMQYMKEHNMQMSEADLARNFIEYDLEQSGNVITPEFDGLLRELFDETTPPRTPEVQIARICSESIEGIKRIENNSTLKPVDLLYSFSKDIENESIKAGKPTPSAKLQTMLQRVPPETDEISDEERRKIYEDLDTFVAYAEENKFDGIYSYIASDDFDRQ